MCGRYSLFQPLDSLAIILELEAPDFELPPRYNAAPSQQLPIITDEDPTHLHLHRWGLIPSWAKDPKIGHKLINARSETAPEKPSFRSAFKRRRCLVPINGFYEWQKTPHGKVPQHITHAEEEVMTLAGLWEVWHDAEEKEWRSFTILTTSPNEIMAPIHDRMPVILAPEDRKTWLDPDADPEDLLLLMRPCPSEWLKTEQVSTLVNSPGNDGPEILQKDTLF